MAMHSEALHAGSSELTSHKKYTLIVACSPDLIAAGSCSPDLIAAGSKENVQEKQELLSVFLTTIT